MMSISNGIIISESSSEKISLRPGKRRRENANAARIVVNVVRPTEQTMTNTELKKYFANGAMANARLKLSRLRRPGSHCGGNLLISCVVLNAEENIQKNGKSMMTAPSARKKYMKNREILLFIFPYLLLALIKLCTTR